MTMNKPKFEDMIPWIGGECPWRGDVYWWLEGNDQGSGPNGGEELCWEEDAGVIAYMPVQLWEEGYRRPNNDCIPEYVKLDLINIDGVDLNGYFPSEIEWTGILLWKPSQQTWNPTSATLDDMAQHCETNMEELMKTNSTGTFDGDRPKDFAGRNLFETESLESLFELYATYNREKQDSETMMQKVLEEIEYRTPNGWQIKQEDYENTLGEDAERIVNVDGVEYRKVGEVNDWHTWKVGDQVLCLDAGEDQCWNEGDVYSVLGITAQDNHMPVKIDNDWLEPELEEFIKVSPKAGE